MKLTDMGTEVIKKRMLAEDKAADEVMGALTDKEKVTLETLCGKIIDKAEEIGVDYSRIQKKRGKRCGKKCCGHKHGHGKGRGHGAHHGSPKYVFVFEEGKGVHHHKR